MPTIHDRTEGKRGCGYRRKGGIYLVCDGVGRPCGKLPIPLTVCPCCSAGIKPSRGWTWVDADKLAGGKGCGFEEDKCGFCPLGGSMGRAGLLWIGGAFYKTPGDWTAEAMRLGVSRRLSTVPKEFVVGDTWVLVAHREAMDVPNPDKATGGWVKAPAIFQAFLPTAIEYVVTDTETTEELERLEKRGFTLIRVHRDDGKPTLAPGERDASDTDEDDDE